MKTKFAAAVFLGLLITMMIPAAVFADDSGEITGFEVSDYSAYSGKYILYFDPVEGAESYNVYNEGSGALIKSITQPGEYIDASDIANTSGTDGEYIGFEIAAVVGGVETARATYELTAPERIGDYTDAAQIYIHCDGNPIKDSYKSAVITVVDKDGGVNADIVDAASQIKIRGNTTSTAPKKPWNIKFSSKKSLLGMDKGKKWCLLANAYDKSLMRATLAHKFAQDAGVWFTPDTRIAEVYINGRYNGCYTVTEPVSAGKGRVDIDSEKDNTPDILLEVGHKTSDTDVDYFVTEKMNVKLSVNSPERGDIYEDDPVADQAAIDRKIAGAKSLIDGFEQALLNKDFETASSYIDVDSFVNFYVVCEYWKVKDFNISSTRFFIKGDKLYAGPLWDVDLSSGNCRQTAFPDYYIDNVSYKGIWCDKENTWYCKLTKSPEFMELVRERYAQLKPLIRALYTDNSSEESNSTYSVFAENDATFYRDSLSRNLYGAGWSLQIDNPYNFMGLASTAGWTEYTQPVEQLRSWLSDRDAWLSERWDTSKNEVIIDGELAGYYNNGETVTLPSGADIGYTTGDKLYRPGSTVTVNSDMDFEEVNISTSPGASIKLTSLSAISFSGTVESKASFPTMETGVLVCSSTQWRIYKKLDKSMVPGLAIDIKGRSISGSDTVKGALAGIGSDRYRSEYISRIYADVVFNGNGESANTTVYGNMSEIRSVRGVALELKSSPIYNYYPGKTKAIIEEMVK